MGSIGEHPACPVLTGARLSSFCNDCIYMRMLWLLDVRGLVGRVAALGVTLAFGWDCAAAPPVSATPDGPERTSSDAVPADSAVVQGTKLVKSKVKSDQLPFSPTIKRFAGRGVKARAKTLMGTDPDGKGRSLARLAPASARGGTLTLSEGWIAYQPPPGLGADDSFDYAVDEGPDGQRVGLVTVVVVGEPAPSSNLACSDRGDGTIVIRGSGIPGRTYQLEFAPAATNAEWQPLGSVTADANGALEYVDNPGHGSPSRNYRLRDN